MSADWPQQNYGLAVAEGVRFEMFVYVEAVDGLVEQLRAGDTSILREPQDMPWGERVAYVADPDGNPIAGQQPERPGRAVLNSNQRSYLAQVNIARLRYPADDPRLREFTDSAQVNRLAERLPGFIWRYPTSDGNLSGAAR